MYIKNHIHKGSCIALLKMTTLFTNIKYIGIIRFLKIKLPRMYIKNHIHKGSCIALLKMTTLFTNINMFYIL